MRTGSLISRVAPIAALFVAAACGGKPPPAPTAAAPPSPSLAPSAAPVAQKPAAKDKEREKPSIPIVTPSRILPSSLDRRYLVSANEPEDGKRYLVSRMRVLVRDDGSIERANELFPLGHVSHARLPSRLGGGFLFWVNGGGGTQVWRASGWLNKLEPIVQLTTVVNEIVPGFDRLYVRFTSGNRLIALDPKTGATMGLGPLPPAVAYGALAFADGWRAIIETDLRGPLVTFDAGGTYRPLGIPERPLSIRTQNGVFIVQVPGGQYVIDERGGVTHRTEYSDPKPSRAEAHAPLKGPLGPRPLRTAIEDGWPDGEGSALVARGGALAKVSLRDGSVRALAEEAYPESLATCHAVRLGASGVGFICGEREGATTIYEHVPPLGMRVVMRFDKPRYVSAGENGTLVIRGGCDDSVRPASEARPYCVRAQNGSLREVQIRGDIGTERVAALADGRVVVLVPPRAGTPGTITVLSGAAAKSATLRLPAEARAASRELRRGMWLEGFEERAPGVIGGWVEAGGPFVGVAIDLDGVVRAGDVRDDASGAVFSGRFGMALMEGGRAAETTDGGLTWNAFDMPPDHDDDADERLRASSRACGPVGCVLGGWIRVGYGDPDATDDLKLATPPSALPSALKAPQTLAMSCDVRAATTPPLPDKPVAHPKAPPPPPPPSIRRPFRIPTGRLSISREPSPTGWRAFRNTAPPPLAQDEVGFDNGPLYDTVQLRAYAWGKRGSDWTRTGRWIVRFDDRFDASGGFRSSSPTASLWADEGHALEGIGTGSYGSQSWSGVLDPSGKSMLASSCRGSMCWFYAVADGQPVLPIRDLSGRVAMFQRPYAHGAVKLGESWYFVTPSNSYEAVVLHRVELGSARPIGTYHRPPSRYGYGVEAPRVVRRAQGGALGLLIASPPDPGERSGKFYVLPVNPDTGALSDAVPLGRRDFIGVPLERCAPGQDGWVVDVSMEPVPAIDLENARGTLEYVEARVRLDPGFACVEGLSARMPGTFAAIPPKPVPGAKPPREPPKPPPFAPRPVQHTPAEEASSIGLSATERSTGKRWSLSCRIKPRK